MNPGYYSPIFRMAASQVTQMEAVTENLANATMPGYKRLNINHRVFETLLNEMRAHMPRWESASNYDPINIDFTPGAIKPTDRPLDFAICGEGFFVVTNKDTREFYTRNGHFMVDKQGNLINADGFRVEGENGPIAIPQDVSLRNLTVDAKGQIRDGTRVIGTLKIVTFNDLTKLVRAGTTLFQAPAGLKQMPPPKETQITNNALEGSNTSIFSELTETISCLRTYEACQRMLRNEDDLTGKMITQLS